MAAANAVLPEQPISSAVTTRLDLNSPPPASIIGSNTSSSSSSSSPSRSEISSSCVSMSAAAAAAATAPPPKKAGGGSSSPAEAEAIKQQLAATTFIQADVMSFREVVQKHTGAAEDAQDKMPVTVPARQAGGSKQQQQNGAAAAVENGSTGKADPPPAAPPRRHSYKLHERKQKNIHNLDIVRQTVSPFKRPGCSPRGGEAGSSPKLLYDPLLVSPVTPLSGEAFETSNPPLTPTEQLRQSFAASLHCCEDPNAAATRLPGFTPAINGHHHHHGGVLDRFPFLQGSSPHNVVVHQQQNGNQQQQHHHHHQHGHVLSPVLGNHHHHILQQNHHHHQQQQQQQHFVYEQQQQQHQEQQISRNREPELLDLFPVHSPRLKETQGSSR